MRACPWVRKQEFLQLFRLEPIQPNDVILDIPSLGGYLGWYIADFGSIISLDFSESFQAGIRTVSPYGQWGLSEKVTRVICIAALHHVEDLSSFLDNLSSQTEVGVRVHLADVGKGSRIGRFLDDFVGKHTPMGHVGNYRDWTQIEFPSSLSCLDVATLPCPWSFSEPAAAARFARMLFGLVDCSDSDILHAFETMVGMDRNADGGITIHWQLTYVDLRRV